MYTMINDADYFFSRQSIKKLHTISQFGSNISDYEMHRGFKESAASF